MPYGAADVVEDAPHEAVHPSDAARGEAASWEQETSAPGGLTWTAARSGSVLVVDDNADMRAYLTRLLAPHWAVRTTANGEEALAAVAEQAPDMVLTDVMMPRIDGFELLRRLRADAATRDIPVIMLTARAGQEASVEGLEAGADDYLAKPFRTEELSPASGWRWNGRPDGARPSTAAPPTAPIPVGGTAGARLPRPDWPGPRPPPPRRAARRGPAGVTRSWRLPSEAAVDPGAAAAPPGLAGLARASTRTSPTTSCWRRARRRPTPSSTPRSPTEPFIDVAAGVTDGRVRIAVRDYGQWRERMPRDGPRPRRHADERGRRDHRDAESRGHDRGDHRPARR